MKKFLIAAALVVSVLTGLSASRAAETFGVGSPAPPLDVEHWVQDGNGALEPVTKFEEGKVYVVEFWATWCGPCVASMPHLAEMQERYRKDGVRIISISNEKLETVEKFLEKEGPENKTFDEITEAYSLTTDPDGSAYEDYMDAANQQGIPTAFIVGKDGIVEWIGHPMSMEDPDSGEPLVKVVKGTWDREKFKEEFQEQNRFQEVMQQVARHAQQGEMSEAVKLVKKEVDNAKTPEVKGQLSSLLNSLKLSAGQVDDEVRAYFAGQLESIQGNPLEVGRFGYLIYNALQSGADVGTLANDAVKAIEGTVGDSPDQYKPFLYNQLAQLHEAQEHLDEAIAAQEKAVEASEGQAKQRMTLYLNELKEAKNPTNKSGEEKSDEK